MVVVSVGIADPGQATTEIQVRVLKAELLEISRPGHDASIALECVGALGLEPDAYGRAASAKGVYLTHDRLLLGRNDPMRIYDLGEGAAVFREGYLDFVTPYEPAPPEFGKKRVMLLLQTCRIDVNHPSTRFPNGGAEFGLFAGELGSFGMNYGEAFLVHAVGTGEVGVSVGGVVDMGTNEDGTGIVIVDGHAQVLWTAPPK